MDGADADADVIIYAATPAHPLGGRVAALFPRRPSSAQGQFVGVGSVLLLPELLTKPTRERREKELAALDYLLAWLDLRPADAPTALLAVALGASYGLAAADAVHLATAVRAGADRFITNGRGDFTKQISEIAITYPSEL